MIVQTLKPSQFKAVISTSKKAEIMAYLQGAVYCWCKNQPDTTMPVPNQPNHFMSKWFNIPALFGGTNFDWAGTPLYELYDYWDKQGAQYPIQKAGFDLGNLLKELLLSDHRTFNTKKTGQNAREYQWTGT
jgi:hypothetical protein